MNMDQWAEFRRKFPSAAAFMDRKDLENEHKRLTDESAFLEDYRKRHGRIGSEDEKRLTWVKGRLHELNKLPMFAKAS